jgi:hypothetical protein
LGDSSTGHQNRAQAFRQEVQLPTRTVDWINYQESKMSVNLTKEAILQAPACDDASVGAAPKEAR